MPAWYAELMLTDPNHQNVAAAMAGTLPLTPRRARRAFSRAILPLATLALAAAGLFAGCATSPSANDGGLAAGPCLPAPPSAVDLVQRYLTGSFSSAQQAAGDPEYRAITLHTARIWTDRDDGPWLYVEQAMAERPDRPYRQRVYRLRTEPDGRVRSDVFTLPGDPLRFAGAWRDHSLLQSITPDQLTLRDGCAVLLRIEPDGTFLGGTEGSSCASDLRGATYATSKVRLDSFGLESWDQGFDAQGAQVWGATKGPYRFLRLPAFTPARS